MRPGSLLDHVFAEPQAFDFFQAVQLLEQLFPDREAVGEFADPKTEVVRFSTSTGVSFPASAIQSLESGDPEAPVEMEVNFVGLTGPQGVLPLDYSLYAAQRVRAGDHAMKDFLGIFEHRVISLFYRAWTRSRAGLALGNESPNNSRSSRKPHDWLTGHLLSLVGLGLPSLRKKLPISDESLLYFAGLLSVSTRPAAALEQLIGDYFDVPVEVEQFVGAWYPLTRTAQTSLGDETAFAAPIGGGAVAGDEIWDEQGRVRVRIGPLTRRRYDEFLPGGPAYDGLRAVTRFFANDQIDFEIQLVLARDEAPPCRLDSDDAPLPLGWCTWLSTGPLERDPDDALFAI